MRLPARRSLSRISNVGGHERQNLGRDRDQFGANGGAARRRQPETPAQGIMMGEQAIDLVVERIRIGEVHQPDRPPRDLVLVGRADAALGGADLGPAGVPRFAMGVEFAMQRQDQRDVLGDLEVCRRHLDPLAAQFLDLLDEMIGIEDDAIADDRQLSRANDAGGKQRKLIGLAVDHERVAGVVAALKPHDHVGADR